MVCLNRIVSAAVLIAALNFFLPLARGAISVVSYWRMGEQDQGAAPELVATNTTDGLGTNTIAFTGSPTYSSNVAASASAGVGSTLCINFTNSCYGLCPVVSTAVDNFGIELWVNSAGTSGNQCLAYNGNTSASGWGLYQIGGTYSGLIGGRVIFGAGTITPGVWTHLALVCNNGTTTLYVNGVASGSTGIIPAAANGGFAVAAPPTNPTRELFSGYLDEVRVFTFAPGQFSTNDLLITKGFQNTSPMPPTTWHFVSTGSMATAHRLQTAVLLTNGQVLVAGGQDQDNPMDVELYNFATGSWSNTAPTSLYGFDQAGVLLLDGRVLMAGGDELDLNIISTNCEIYNPSTGAWTNTGPLNVGHMYGVAVALTNGNVLLAGGNGPGFVSTADAEIYSPATGLWTNTTSMANARNRHGLVLLTDGRVLAVGGDSAGGGAFTSAEIYNPITALWSNAAPLNVARDYVTATVLTNGNVLVTGGGVANGEVYNPGSNTWTLTGPMALGRLGDTATLLQNGQVLVTGGLQDSLDSYASTEIYNPSLNTWTNGPTMNVGRRYHAATLLPNGQVLISGGDTGPALTDAAELFVAPESAQPLLAASKAAGGFQISFTNSPSALFNILASSDLRQPISAWTNLGNVVEGPVGHFQWSDTSTTNGSIRFYRVRNQ